MRIERTILGRTGSIATRAAGVLAELETNQLAEDSDRSRIGDQIVRPLEELCAGELRIAAEALAEAAREASRPGGSARSWLEAADPAAERALIVMEEVLGHMMKQETFGEVLSILREVIRLHGDAGEEAARERRRRILDVLEGEGER
jgi:hypothetical protein